MYRGLYRGPHLVILTYIRVPNVRQMLQSAKWLAFINIVDRYTLPWFVLRVLRFFQLNLNLMNYIWGLKNTRSSLQKNSRMVWEVIILLSDSRSFEDTIFRFILYWYETAIVYVKVKIVVIFGVSLTHVERKGTWNKYSRAVMYVHTVKNCLQWRGWNMVSGAIAFIVIFTFVL